MRATLPIVFALSALVLSAAPAEAAKPTRGCPDKFTLVDIPYMKTVFPDLPDDVHEAIFSSIDKNGDGWLCGKANVELERKLNYITVDNVSNHDG